MEFGKPHDIEPQPLGLVHLLHRFVESLALAASRERWKLVKHAEFHGVLLPRLPGWVEQSRGSSQGRNSASTAPCGVTEHCAIAARCSRYCTWSDHRRYDNLGAELREGPS